MNDHPISLDLSLPWALRRTGRAGYIALVAACALLAAVSGCGGGVGTGGTGASASYVSGPVTGLGSVIVAGIRFDDNCDCVEDADGAKRDRTELRLGMTVEIESDAVQPDAAGVLAAKATRVRLGSELVGAASAIDVANARLVVAGHPVRVNASTVFDDSLAGGLVALASGAGVEVYGFFDPATAGYTATRIERRSSTVTSFRVRGPIGDIDRAALVLRIGSQVYDISALAAVPATLAPGQFVRLAVAPAAIAPARWRVSALLSGARAIIDDRDRDRAEIEGFITAIASPTRFSVDGVPVDASGLAGLPSGLTVGTRVEVEGQTRSGVLVASAIKVRTEDAVRSEGFELHGAIESVNRTTDTLVLRGLTVFFAGNPPPRFDKGTAADLAVGRRIEVRGMLSADRTRIVATRIGFED